MIVADTNLLAYLLLPTAFAAQAEAVYLKDSDWTAPALIHSEFRNVLLGAVRRGDIAFDDVGSFLARACEAIAIPAGTVDGNEVFALAMQSGCSAYDCEFVWLARELGVRLVTADQKVLKAFPELAVSPAKFIG